MSTGKNKKTIVLSSESKAKLDFLKELFEVSEKDIFVMALNKLYKEYK